MAAGFTTNVDRRGETCIRISHDQSRVRRPGKPRSVRILAGLGAGAIYGVHTDSLKNLARGIVERVFYVSNGSGLARPPQPLKGVFGRLSNIRKRLLRKMRPTPVVAASDYAGLYNGRKRLVYQRAADSLMVRAVNRSDSYVSTFVKAEKVNFSSKVDPAPRVIQPRSPRYNLSVGRYLKLFEGEMCSAFKRVFGYSVVTKGMNADQVGNTIAGHWRQFARPVAVGLDASRFDQHVSRDALRWEHSVYKAVFNSPELAELLSWQLSNRGIARVGRDRVDYRVDGCRMSGDINTGMGNCLIMSSIVLAYFDFVGLDARLVNNGDDCVVVCESGDLHKLDGIEQWFLDFGFKLVTEAPVYVLERVVFCQAQPVLVGDGYRMVRDPRTAMSKDCVSLLSWEQEDDFHAWCHAIGSCGSQLTSGVPVWEKYYGAISRPGIMRQSAVEAICETGMSYMARGVSKADVSEEGRYSFYCAFGILPDAQEAAERVYDQTCVSYSVPVPMTYPDVKSIDSKINPIYHAT